MAITKELITDVFDAIKSTLGDGVEMCVAGGAPRDLFIGRNAPSDIDLYLKVDNLNEYRKHLKDLEDIFGVCEPVGSHIHGYGPKSTILGVGEFTSEDDDKLQIMGFSADCVKGNLLDSVFRSYDFGICMIGYDSEMNLRWTPEFTADYYHRSLTLVSWASPFHLYKSIKHHLPKLQKKFPGYRFRSSLEEYEGFGLKDNGLEDIILNVLPQEPGEAVQLKPWDLRKIPQDFIVDNAFKFEDLRERIKIEEIWAELKNQA